MIQDDDTSSEPTKGSFHVTEGPNIDPSRADDPFERDTMFEEAARCIVLHQQGSTSLLQRKLQLGYNRAGRLINQLQHAGIVGPFEGSKARNVLIPDENQLDLLLAYLDLPASTLPAPPLLKQESPAALPDAHELSSFPPSVTLQQLTYGAEALGSPLLPEGSSDITLDNVELPSLLSFFTDPPSGPDIAVVATSFANHEAPPTPPLALTPAENVPVPISQPEPAPTPVAGKSNKRAPSAAPFKLQSSHRASHPHRVTSSQENDLPAEEIPRPPRRILPAVLASLGGMSLLGLVLYLYFDRPLHNEALANSNATATQMTTQMPAAAQNQPTTATELPIAEQTPLLATDSSTTGSSEASATSEPEALSAPEKASITNSVTTDSAGQSEAATPSEAPSGPVPSAPEPGDNEAAVKIRSVLADYYADLFAPPLTASKYFAPQVERLYIQRNLTPAQIDANINQNFFPDNREAVYQVEPGTLRVSDPAEDSSHTATYSEACRLFRVSKGKYQRLRTQVRVRFNADYQITFMRQEKVLGNVFE